MLAQAILYEDQLKRNYIEAACDDYFKFYTGTSYRNFDIRIQQNDWNRIQRVSIDKSGNVIGYMCASFDRESKVINNIGLINFTKQVNVTFAADVIKFLRELRDDYAASKFEFVAFVGGPAEKMYKRFIAKHGGRVVGTLRRTQKLTDGKYYDSTLFEIMREEMNF